MLFQTWFSPGYRPKTNTDESNSFNPRNFTHLINNNTQNHHSNDTNLNLSKEDYNYLVNLMKSSRSEFSTNNKQNDTDPNNHIVSNINKSGDTKSLPSILILDSGASNNFSPYLHSFKTIFKTKPIYVCFPNGSTLLAHNYGTIQFSNHFVIDNVLFLPQFHLNLMSLS